MFDDIAFVYSPRFAVEHLPADTADIGHETRLRLKDMREKWMTVFDLDASKITYGADLEDWTESAVFLFNALHTQRPVYVLYQAYPDRKWEMNWANSLTEDRIREMKKSDHFRNGLEKLTPVFEDAAESVILSQMTRTPALSPRDIISAPESESNLHTIWRLNNAPAIWPVDKPIICLGSYSRPPTDNVPGSFPSENALSHENIEMILHPGYLQALGRDAVLCRYHPKYSEAEKADMIRRTGKIYQHNEPDLIQTCIDIAARNNNTFFLKNITQHKRSRPMRGKDLREHTRAWKDMHARKEPVYAPISDDNAQVWTPNDVYNLIQIEGEDIYFTEKGDLFLAQRLSDISYEYRIILFDGKAVCGAGALENLCPIYNDGAAFDPKVQKKRNHSEIETRPDIVTKLVRFAEETWAQMNAMHPMPESCRITNFDVAMIDGKPGLIESHNVDRLGLYSMNTQPFIDTLLASCLKRRTDISSSSFPS